MKCCIMQHFIWVLAVCQSTRLGVLGLQSVKYIVHVKYDMPFHQHDKNHVQVTTFDGSTSEHHHTKIPATQKKVWSIKKESSEFGLILYEA